MMRRAGADAGTKIRLEKSKLAEREREESVQMIDDADDDDGDNDDDDVCARNCAGV